MLEQIEARDLTPEELRDVTGGTAEHASMPAHRQHPRCGGGHHEHGGGHGGDSYVIDEEIHGIVYIN